MNKEHLRAWNISPHYLLVALLLTAVALAAVVVQTRRAEATDHVTITDVGFTAPTHLAGLTETWTVASRAPGRCDASGDQVIVTFGAGFVIPATPTVSLTGAGWVGVAAPPDRGG